MNNQSNPHLKIMETINKYTPLFQQNKAYQFAQKIKSLAERKMQTNKNQQAEYLLYYGSQAMLKQQTPEVNAANELINILLELYNKQKQLVNEQTSKKLYTLLNFTANQQRIPFFIRIIKSITTIQHSPEICEDLISYYEANNLFWKIEPLVVHFGINRISKFLDKWKNHVDDEEYSIVACRMALLFGVSYTFDQSMVILSELSASHPYVKFVRFLIQSVQMTSREAYNKLGTSYKAFLDSDSFYLNMYELYGNKFFKIEKKHVSGLQGLMSALQ